MDAVPWPNERLCVPKARGPEERASSIPWRSGSDREKGFGSPIRSRTGFEKIPAQDFRDAEDDVIEYHSAQKIIRYGAPGINAV